jgi:hypothetical protein
LQRWKKHIAKITSLSSNTRIKSNSQNHLTGKGCPAQVTKQLEMEIMQFFHLIRGKACKATVDMIAAKYLSLKREEIAFQKLIGKLSYVAFGDFLEPTTLCQDAQRIDTDKRQRKGSFCCFH